MADAASFRSHIFEYWLAKQRAESGGAFTGQKLPKFADGHPAMLTG